MANSVFNIAKGSAVEKVRDDAVNVGMLFLQAAQADTSLIDHEDIAALLLDASNTEATFTNYSRKTGVTGTILIDHPNDRVDLSVPDQTFTAAGGAANNTLVKAVFYYEEAANDASRIPMSQHDFAATTDGNDLIADVGVNGIIRSA